MVYKPRRVICVFCVYRLSASALKYFLGAVPQGWKCGPRLYAIAARPSFDLGTLNRYHDIPFMPDGRQPPPMPPPDDVPFDE
jgi:hypothetical protein